MPETLNNYVLQERPIVPGLDLGIAQNTLATITAGNKEALQQQNALRTAIAEMDLNEAEDGFRQQLYDDITKTVEDNSIEGNAYYALDDIIKKQGDIASNPGLLGRLKAQKEYKKFNETLDARVLKGDISQDTADWAKAMNPYKYQDKIDNTGKVIGGTEWKPGITPVKDIDFNDVLKLAAQYASPEAGGNTVATFLGADGKPTSNPTNSYGVLNTVTGQWEKLTPEKLLAGVQAAMNANPEYAAGLQQAYKVLNWKYKNGQDTVGLIDPKTNKPKSFNDYVTDMINPFLRAKSYNRYVSETKYHDAAFKALNTAKNPKGSTKLRDPNNAQIIGSEGYDIEWNDTSRAQALQSIGYTNAVVKDYISQFDKDGTVDPAMINIRDTESMINYLKSVGINDEKTLTSIKDFAEKEVAKNKDAYRYYDNLLAQNDKSGAATIMSDYIQGATDVADEFLQTNSYLAKYVDKYNDIINNSFGDKQNFGFKMNQKEYNRLIERLGGSEQMATNQGFKLRNDGKDYIVYINRKDARLYGQFMDAIKETYDETSWWSKNITQRNKFVNFDDNDSDIEDFKRQPYLPLPYRAYASDNFNYQPLTDYELFKKDLNKNKDLTKNPETRIIGGTNIPGINPRQFGAKEGIYGAETKEELDYFTKLDEAIDKHIVDDILNPANIINTRAGLVKDGVFIPLDSEKKKILADQINGNANKVQKSMFYNPAEGTITPQLIYRYSATGKDVNPFTGDKTPLIFTSEGLIKDPEIQALINSDDYRASSTLFRNNVNNINTDVGYYKNESGKYIHYSLTPILGVYQGDNYRNIVLDDGTIVAQGISEDSAKDLLILFNQIQDLSIMLNSPTNTPAQNKFIQSLIEAKKEQVPSNIFGEEILNVMINTYMN